MLGKVKKFVLPDQGLRHSSVLLNKNGTEL